MHDEGSRESFMTPIDTSIETLMDEIRERRAMGLPTVGSRGAADIPQSENG